MKKAVMCVAVLVMLTEATAFAQSDVMFKVQIKNVSKVFSYSATGVFNTPVGASDPAPIGPGGAYEFSFYAAPGAYVSFASMFVPSNDLFYGPNENGIALFDMDGMPMTGDITDQIYLWDAGSEMNQEPGVGMDQPQRQSGADTGDMDSDNTVRMVSDGFTYPMVSEVLSVMLSNPAPNMFTVRIENISTDTTLNPSDGTHQAVPLAPGIWVVHSAAGPLFTMGEAERGEGLEALAEDGNPAVLHEMLASVTGLTVPLAPGVWATHTDAAPLFEMGQSDRGDGLEALAEDGNPAVLGSALENMMGIASSGVFNTPVGSRDPAPIFPGGMYEFMVSAKPGDMLSFATMFVHSNDLFYAPDENGIALFEMDGTPVSGSVTDQLYLWDAGTEENQPPGVGADQAPRQTGPDTGMDDPDNTVRMVNDGFTYPMTEDVIEVTVIPIIPTPFVVRIENVATDSTLMPSDGSKQPVPLAPGAWAVHTSPGAIFNMGETYPENGLEKLAEDGDPSMLAEALSSQMGVMSSGVFNTPDGATEPGALLPGSTYEFMVYAVPGANLSFATMFIPSNDLFYAPADSGISLFTKAGMPVTGNITDQIMLWDAGTEENQEPGVGADQPQRQSGPNTGMMDSDSTVRMVSDGYMYPAVNQVVRVTIMPVELTRFTLHIENVSTDQTLKPSDGSMQPVPLAPGVWTVHTHAMPIFTAAEADRGEGLEMLAEDGDPSMLATSLMTNMDALFSGVFNTPVGEAGPGPLLPGGVYEATFQAAPGTWLSFASMFVPSNDLFYSPDAYGIELFSENGTPMTGDITSQIMLWDAGTEENQEPGTGADQPQRQSGPNTGADDMLNTVRLVSDAFTYPQVSDVIKVTLTTGFTSVKQTSSEKPESFQLSQNYPNPFNPETQIHYSIVKPGNVRLSVFNTLGQEIAVLVNRVHEAGSYQVQWDGTNDQGAKVVSGLYFYRLDTDGISEIRRMTLLK